MIITPTRSRNNTPSRSRNNTMLKTSENTLSMAKKRDDLRKRNNFFYQTLRGATVQFSPLGHNSKTPDEIFTTNPLSRARIKMFKDVTKAQ